MTAMRRLLALLLLAGWTAARAPKVSARPPEARAVDQARRVVMVEARREYDAALVDAWLHHENPLHRQRAALMLARIGPANEHAPIVAALAPLTADAEANVRATAAFALGQIGELSSAPALLQFVADKDGDVAGESVEALSKLAPKLPFASYA